MYDLQRAKRNQHTPLNRFNSSTFDKSSTESGSNVDRCAELAKLSQGSKWVLLTNECPKPRASTLKRYQINAKHLLQMMPSRKMTEKEVVLKALQSGNASAVIASKSISAIDQKHLLQRAAQLNCTLLFTHDASELFPLEGSLVH